MITTDARRTQPPIGLLLSKLNGLIDEQFERTLSAHNATRRQWQLLHTLAEHPTALEALNMAVAPFLDRTAGETVTPHLEPLAKRGLVTVEGNVYNLSDSGRRLFRSLAEDVQNIRDRITRGLADGDYDHTLATLQTMIENLEERP